MLIDELRDCGDTLVVEGNASRPPPSHVPSVRLPSTCLRSWVREEADRQGGCGGVGQIEGGEGREVL